MNFAADEVMLETVCVEAYLGAERDHWSNSVDGESYDLRGGRSRRF